MGNVKDCAHLLLIQPGLREARLDPPGSNNKVDTEGLERCVEWGEECSNSSERAGLGCPSCHSSDFFTKELENPGLLPFCKTPAHL